MGSDIHLFAEYRDADGIGWMAVSDGEFLLDRDGDLFAAMGRRSNSTPARGIPSNVSRHVAEHYFVPILDAGDAQSWGVGTYASPETAAHWLSTGGSERKPEGTTTPLTPSPYGYVSCPDWHSPSWMTTDELSVVLAGAHPQGLVARDLRLLVAYLRSIDEVRGTITRVVYWFDN